MSNQKFYTREHMERSLMKAFADDAGWDVGSFEVQWEYDGDDCILGARVIRKQAGRKESLHWMSPSGTMGYVTDMSVGQLEAAIETLQAELETKLEKRK